MARTDAERLDWLAANSKWIICARMVDGREMFRFASAKSFTTPEDYAPTAREIIDRAMDAVAVPAHDSVRVSDAATPEGL